MSSKFGNKLKVEIFGASHSEKIGVIIEGLPIGTKIDMESVQRLVDRRRAKDLLSTARREADRAEAADGIENGRTTKDRIVLEIKNGDVKSSDYESIRFTPRPGHADYTAFVKYEGKNDYRGGGIFSGRMTAPLCIAGAIAEDILREKGITVGCHIASVMDISDTPFDPVSVNASLLEEIKNRPFPTINLNVGEAMKDEILKARSNKDSVGGIVEGAIVGLPVGIGEPTYGGVENVIAANMFGIPAVKGIEFGNGFGAAKLFGSENNDEFYYDEAGEVKTKTNNAGGINGGITNGMPVIVRVAFKPTPSIAKEQNTINLESKTNTKISVPGRHDPCIVQRAVPAVESILAVSVLDLIMQKE